LGLSAIAAVVARMTSQLSEAAASRLITVFLRLPGQFPRSTGFIDCVIGEFTLGDFLVYERITAAGPNYNLGSDRGISAARNLRTTRDLVTDPYRYVKRGFLPANVCKPPRGRDRCQIAAGEVYSRHDLAAENIAVPVCVRRLGDRADRQLHIRGLIRGFVSV